MYNPNYHYFQGKTIVISGSSKGIGRTLARELGLMGAHIVLNGTNKQALAATETELRVNGIDVMSVTGNVANINDCEAIARAAVSRYGSIDIVFANAGMSAMGSVEETDADVFKQLMEVNYLGVVYLIKACLPALKLSKGSIMITGSASGIRGIPGASAYSASKMALTALAESLRIELSNTGVHVSLAYVGFTENDAGKLMLDAKGQLVAKEKVARGAVASQVFVAAKMIGMVQERSFSEVFSAIGRLNFIVNRFAPWLAHLILKRYYHKSMDQPQKIVIGNSIS
jgi:dehydrogenase/reductase SDR family protein 7B